MWYKYVIVMAVVVIIALVILSSQNKEQGISLNRDHALTRSATNVVMFERKKDTGKTMVVSAKEVVETGDQVAYLKDFRLVQQKGVKMIGKDATYDRNRSILEVKGPLSMETKDGAQAQLNGFVWDRESQKAYTRNPVKLEGQEGTIVADRAEFSDEFTQIALIGRVHAKIAQDFLNH
jgi:lipopolysaccharide assembly outer membrane protein LptD (OstA)